MKILIIDDSSSARTYTTNCLESCFGINKPEIVTASEGPEAIKILENQTDFCLIISDLMMPLVGGKKLLAKLQANEMTKNIPVIFVTAQSDTGAKDEDLIKLGARAVLGKPIDKTKLLKVLLKLNLLDTGW